MDSIRASSAAGSGHPTSSMSGADLMAVLLSAHLRYDFDDPSDPRNDHLIFSKGHASPLLYAMYLAAGAITDDELLSFRKQGSRIEGHPTPVLPWVDVATGSLGQGLPIGVGHALAGKMLDRLPYRVWVLCGDSEMAEGSMYEAMEHAAHSGLDNLTAIVDVNRLGQTGETMHGWDLDAYVRRAQAAGWHAIAIDGHDVDEIDHAYADAAATELRPTMIVARTEKGRGCPPWPTRTGSTASRSPTRTPPSPSWAGCAPSASRSTRPTAAGAATGAGARGRPPPRLRARHDGGDAPRVRRRARGAGHARAEVVALDGEVSNSTYAEIYREAHPDRYFEMYIAEQQLVAAAVGMQVRGWRPFASTFAAFLTRAYDFIRMAAVSRANMAWSARMPVSRLARTAIPDGARGPGHDAGRPRQHRALPVRREPGRRAGGRDGRPTRHLVPAHDTREDPGHLSAGEKFPIGGARVVRSPPTTRSPWSARASPSTSPSRPPNGWPRTASRPGDRPVQHQADRRGHARPGRRRHRTAGDGEDHWPEGGLGDAVLEVFAGEPEPPRIVRLAVRDMPGSATPAQQLAAAGIDADAIVTAARELRPAPPRNRPRSAG